MSNVSLDRLHAIQQRTASALWVVDEVNHLGGYEFSRVGEDMRNKRSQKTWKRNEAEVERQASIASTACRIRLAWSLGFMET